MKNLNYLIKKCKGAFIYNSHFFNINNNLGVLNEIKNYFVHLFFVG